MWYHRGLAGLTVLALALAGVISSHEHDKQHSHFCEGGGYTLFCKENLSLRIDKAWYGRMAHDTSSCVDSTSDNKTTPQPDLAQDCGSSILPSKDAWCHNSQNGSCTIAVENLGPAVDAVRCPDNVVKYLYLEYECVGDSSSATGARAPVLFVQIALVLVLALSGSLP